MTEQLELELTAPVQTKPAIFFVRGQAMTLAEFEAGERKAGKQDAEILAVFQARPGVRLGPWQVLDILNQETLGGAPIITSVRRSVTTLTKRGLLVHHRKERRPGPHGSAESLWSLNA